MITNSIHASRSPRVCSRPPRASSGIRSASALSDDRWDAIRQALADLRAAGRHSVRIVDADCGAGRLLVHAVQYARARGFTAIEGRGIDGAPSLIARARTSANRLHDPAIGLTFEATDLLAALEEEAEFPADIVLWNGRPAAFEQRPVLEALRLAAACLITDTCRSCAPVAEQRH